MELVKEIFEKLNRRVDQENQERRQTGSPSIGPSSITLLGQFSLLANPTVAAKLHLNQTADVDALINAHHFVKSSLKAILKDNDLEYDEDSDKVWIPPQHDSSFIPVFASVCEYSRPGISFGIESSEGSA